ncbi:MAG: hypothetical protein ACRCWD_01845 [Culicoidibacterales bacterium]
MKNLTIITGVGIIAMSIVATSVMNAIYLASFFLVASALALAIQFASKKWSMAPFISLTLLVSSVSVLRLGLSVIEPTLANEPIVFALAFQPLLVTMAVPSEWDFPLFTWIKAVMASVSALVIIGFIVELLSTGMIFGYELPMVEASSFFQTPAGILFISAFVIALMQVRKRGEVA